VTSSTSVQRGAAVPLITLHWSPAPWLRHAAAATSTAIRTSLVAARDYEGARTVSARRAALARFTAQNR
jgi:hypothetical protein